MSKMTLPIIAVVAIAAVAIAGGAFFLNGNDSGSDDGGDDQSIAAITTIPAVSDYARLNLLGNADMDDDIDADDIAYLEGVIAGTKTNNFYCDVNQDGYINAADVNALKKMKDRIATEVFFVDANNTIKSANLPIENIVMGFRRSAEMVGFLGCADQIVGLTEGAKNEFGFVGYSDVAKNNVINPGNNSDGGVQSEIILNMYKKDFKNTGFTIIGAGNGMDADMEKYVDGLPIDVLRLCCTENGRIAEGMVTMAFMLGYNSNYTAVVKERLDWWVSQNDALDAKIANAVKDLKTEDKKKGLITLFDVYNGGGLRIRGSSLTETAISVQAGNNSLAYLFEKGGAYATLDKESLPEAQKTYGLEYLVVQNQSLYRRVLAAYNAASDDAGREAALNLIISDSADIVKDDKLNNYSGKRFFVGQDLCNGPETLIYKMICAHLFAGLDSEFTEEKINQAQSEYMAMLNPSCPLKDAKVFYKMP